MSAFPGAQHVIQQAIASRVTPCAVVEVGRHSGVTWRVASGRLTYDADARATGTETVFDLASLTKVLATTSLAMRLVDEGRLDLQARVADLLPSWRGVGREAVKVADLLAHSSGLPAHRPLCRSCASREEFERAICSEPLEFTPGTASVYSDLGFILLGFLLEDLAAAPLDVQFERVRDAIGASAELHAGTVSAPVPLEVRYRPPAQWQERIAPTRSESAQPGIVDDGNAAALDGVAAHAGLFGTVSAVGRMASAVLGARLDANDRQAIARHDTVVRFTSRAGVAGSSRALGWDTMLPTSSCGTRMSSQAFGHTGFTGTSLWIDPVADIYVVLLTNRGYPAPRNAEGITALRRAVHDAVMDEVVE